MINKGLTVINSRNILIQGSLKFDGFEDAYAKPMKEKDYSKISYDGWSILKSANSLESLLNFLYDEQEQGYLDFVKINIGDNFVDITFSKDDEDEGNSVFYKLSNLSIQI